MKPLKLKTRVGEAEAASARPVTTASATSGANPPADHTSAASPPLVPSPPSAHPTKAEHPPPSRSGRPTSASSVATTTATIARRTTDGHAGVRFTSELDNANVDAYLEYLTRPHTSWDSATQHLARRREVIEGHRASVFARSLASSRRSSFASTMRSEGGDDVLEMSMTSSVASAPAGFPRSASNASKTHTGKLRKGRLGDTNSVPAPPSLVATGNGPSSAVLLPTTSLSGANGDQSRTTSSHSSVSTGKPRTAPTRGRLARGGALAMSRAPRVPTAASASAGAATGTTSGPDLTIGGTHLQTGSTNLFIGGVQSTTAGSSRSGSRDGAASHRGANAPMKGSRSVGSA
ncbi:hypothetical protein ABB37_02057 [Leptomonas pyrrhocoris]|uniref:Uncharacterized protein n=1 Tax=Leptomonas pyrrhocoris TaxID=157538 RepID=A0A0N1J571_LEPPY|nr:hypothetical protein ABB37_02057 [Leptomonas pyrrhocoris]KPA83864.1 hypothetical protein ABB37_02057 [Leptomonas pyrrhocoris]|eukprot:XP_015662303.1 hypothetical protein ABB37_02057 [Leptomonas pyrrhocoris]